MKAKASIIQFGLFLIFFLATFSCKEEIADPLTSLTMHWDTIFVLGEEKQLTANWNPGSGVDPDLSWESSNPHVLTITGSGFAKGVGVGKALVTVRVHDGTGLQSSRIVLVQEQPEISITSVTDITFHSASVALNYNLGGGDLSNSSITFYWSTSSVLDTINCQGKLRVNEEKQVYSLDLFDHDTSYYVWAYIKNRVGSEFSNSVAIETGTIPADILGNYMLNIPLAKGTVAKYKDWIYYSNYNDNQRLYKIRTDLTEKQAVVTYLNGIPWKPEYVKSLNIIGGDIYFSYAKKAHGYISKMKADGTNLTFFKDEDDTPISTFEAFIVIGKYIYPESSGRIFSRVSIDCDEFQLRNFININNNFYNNKLYFYISKVDNIDSLYSVNVSNTDFTGVQELYRGYYYYPVLGVYENSAYLIEGEKFKKIDLEFPELIQILPIKPRYFNIVNHTIFYSNKEDNNKLYKCDLAGNSPVKMADDQVSRISVIDDWLYYYGYSDTHLYRIKQDGTTRQIVE